MARVHPCTAVPTRLPNPNVTAAASIPKMTCLPPERSALEPVTIVMATPTAIKATALRTIEATTAGNPLATMKGATGTIAPSAKRQNDVPAATQAEPPRASGSIPSSSRASVSTARPTSPPMIERAVARDC